MSENYEIFLSYSHKDAELLGNEYIEELKRQIEESIGNSVFLDAKALHLGSEWNKEINRCLDSSKIFIYLLSSNYIASEYCNRERLWWKNKEMKNGRLSSTTLPIYFIEIALEERDQKTENWIQQTNDKPWFDIGVKDVLQTDVRKRLAAASEKELHIRQLLTQKGKDGMAMLDVIHSMQEKYALSANSFSSVPCYNLDFVGRIKELADIRSICIKRHGLQFIPLIFGPAGCGKSDLAFAYANGYASDYPGGRFLINMENCHDWKSALSSMVTSHSGKSEEAQISSTVCETLLGIKPEDFNKLNENDRYQMICRALEERCAEKPVLIVLDNVVDQELFSNDQLSQLFGHGIPKNLNIIATTRKRPEGLPFFNANQDEPSLATAYYLGNLDEDSALELFRKHCIYAEFNTNPPDGIEDSHKNQEITRETQAAREIVRLLDCHAWSICHTASAFSDCYKRIEPPNAEGEDPLCLGDKTCEQLLQELQAYFSDELTDKGHLQSVNIEEYADKVMLLTVEQISKLQAGKEVLNFAAIATLFAPDFIPLRLLEAFWKYLNPDSNAASWSTVRDILLKHHILSGPKEKICRMHRLTWKFFRECIKECDHSLDGPAEKLADCIGEFSTRNTLSQQEASALIHMGEAWCNMPWAENNLPFLLITVGSYGATHYLLPELIEYRDLYRKKIETQSWDQLLTASLYSLEGQISLLNADYDNALQCIKARLEILQKHLEPDHLDIAATYNNMALLYDELGEYENALKCYSICRKIEKKHLESDNQDIATTYGNMAKAYTHKGEYDTALKYYNDCLEILTNHLEPDHHSFAAVYGNMGLAYYHKGDYENALKYYNAGLEILTKRFEADHPDIASAYNNIAMVYDRKGEHKTALQYYNACLEIEKKRLEPNHPDIAATYNNMAGMYDELGEYDLALKYYNDSLEILIKRFAPDHPGIAAAYNNMATLYRHKGEYDLALKYYDICLEAAGKRFEPDHPNIAKSYNNIALVYFEKAEYDTALKYYTACLEIQQKNLESDHPDIAATCNNIASAYILKREYNLALPYLTEGIRISTKVFGEEHPDTQRAQFVFSKIEKRVRLQENRARIKTLIREIFRGLMRILKRKSGF